MANLQQAYLLRNLSTDLDSLAPRDKILLLIDGVNVDGDHDVDVSKIIRDGAVVARQQFEYVVVASGVIDSDADVPGDVSVATMIICNGSDLIMDGGE